MVSKVAMDVQQHIEAAEDLLEKADSMLLLKNEDGPLGATNAAMDRVLVVSMAQVHASLANALSTEKLAYAARCSR